MKNSYGKTAFARGIKWPSGQIIPHFEKPADRLDAIFVKELPKGESTAFAVLQGIVNKTKPRLFLIESGVEEGSFAWTEGALDLNIYKTEERYDLLRKYYKEASGFVLYSLQKSHHYRNAAISLAGALNAIPVTSENIANFALEGIRLPILYDLTSLPYENPVDIYTWVYENVWDKCNHRLLVSMPIFDKYHLFDLCGAVSSASVYLDCRIPEEKAVFERFLDDMQAGNGIVMGWYTTERSGISTVASHGLSTLPADYYVNASVFAGLDHYIQKREVPKKPKLENKIYLMIIISDGDNIQYNEHAMRVMWDRIERNGEAGIIPLNWTISPSLPDVGPNIMNHFYKRASENDCFVSGPSGLGYALIVNTLEEPGAPCEDFEKNPEVFREYVRLTDRYLEKSGLSFVTIWDNASEDERNTYTRETNYLRGLTVHVWEDKRTDSSSVNNGKRVQQLVPCYCGDINHFTDNIINQCKKWDGNSPMFIASQVNVWGTITPNALKGLSDKLNETFDNKVEFLRADHFYSLYGEANGLSYDLTLEKETKAYYGKDDISYLLNGTPSKGLFQADTEGEASVLIKLDSLYSISEIVIRHAGSANMSKDLNTSDYKVYLSENGRIYYLAASVKGNTDNANYLKFAGMNAKYMRIEIKDPGSDNIARLACVEIYGKKIK